MKRLMYLEAEVGKEADDEAIDEEGLQEKLAKTNKNWTMTDAGS